MITLALAFSSIFLFHHAC